MTMLETTQSDLVERRKRQLVDYRGALWGTEIQQRFWSKVEKLPTGCWEWRGTLNTKGYGVMSIKNWPYLAHRLLYSKVKGDFPQHFVCDHLCRNHRCVNPDHIEAVPHRINVRRGLAAENCRTRNSSITHCRKGHEFVPSNIRFGKDGGRHCRECDKINGSRWTMRRNAARRSRRNANA